jgi:hypothetical protein
VAIDLTTLIERATAGQPLQQERLFRPSWFYFMEQDPFWLWCHYHGPACESFDETTRFDEFRMGLGKTTESLCRLACYGSVAGGWAHVAIQLIAQGHFVDVSHAISSSEFQVIYGAATSHSAPIYR